MDLRATVPILLLFGLFFIGILSVRLQSPPPLIGKTGPLDEFSALRALEHLKIIAAEPHSAGTAAHEKVRDYIINYCREMGLEVSIQDTMALRNWGSTLSGSHVINVLARLKGRDSTLKHILVLSHYDSQPNTPGAADDGAGVVAMMETIRALKQRAPLEHDVIFLFTDQEEVGLMGAEAFVNANPLVENTGVLLNFESRGNQGVAYTFEVNPENGWVIRQFARGAPYPVANSMAYEVYKVMPNDSDFSMFRKGKYTGVNQANIDGFVNYHSMTDIVENIDPRIIQHHGSNMLGLIRHFDTQNLNETKSPDVNFFNPIGRWLWFYPTSWNIPLIILCVVLVIWFMWLNRPFSQFTAPGIFKGLGLFLLATVLSISLSYVLLLLILKLYPHYTNFYANNFYNAPVYFWLFGGSAVFSFGLIYGLLFKATNSISLFTAVLLFNLILLLGLHYFFPTATYVMYYPLITLMACLLLKLMFKSNVSPLWFLFLGMIPMILLWTPIVHTLYVVFTLVIPYASVLLICILLGMTIPLWQKGGQKLRGMTVLGLLMIVGSFTWGHFTSKPTADKPLQSKLSYLLDHNNNNALWFTPNKFPDSWTAQYVNEQKSSLPLYGEKVRWPNWQGKAAVHAMDNPEVLHQVVPLDSNQYQHNFSITPRREIIGMEVLMQNLNTIGDYRIDGRPINWQVDSTRRMNRVLLFATRKEGVNLTFESKQENGFKLTVIERSLRIPKSWLKDPMPLNHIPGPDSYSDAVFTKETFSF